MLSIELKKSDLSATPDEIEIVLDGEGLDSLLAQLRFLQGRADHVHLMSEAWGGSHLEGIAQTEANSIIHHVKITRILP